MNSKLWRCLVSGTLIVGCGRAPDTEENVRSALEQANVDSVEVAVDERGSVVHLLGSVETIADRTRAEEIALATIGTTGRVLNEITVERLADTPHDVDSAIADRIDRLLDADPILRERDINVTVSQSTVAITGEVKSLAEKNRVERLIRATQGVSDVANKLDVRLEP